MPWSVPVAVDAVSDGGQRFDLAAGPQERTAVAKMAGLQALPRLAASFEVTRQGAGLHVVGQVWAEVGQTCIVTLEPIEGRVVEAVDLIFAPVASGAAEPATKGGKQVREAPEPLIGGVVDLGALATEFLLLGIDPYPRKEGATFAPQHTEDAGAHPFAALEALKKRLGNKPS